MENNQIVSDDTEVAKIFNNSFVNVAKEIGQDYIFDRENHPSIKKNGPLEKSNQIFEKILADQLSEHFDGIFNNFQ